MTDAYDAAPDTAPTGEPPICAAARALIGLTEDTDAYRAIVDPAGPYAEEVAVAHAVSSCMLVAAWLRGWRGRFVAATIQNTLRQICGGTGRVPDEDNFASVGDGVWWEASATADEHVDAAIVAVTRRALDVVTFDAVAGGQRVGGRRGIALVTRTAVFGGIFWTDQADGRRVRGVLDA